MAGQPYDPDWFEIRKAAPGIFILGEPGHVNSYLVCGTRKAALIDTGMGFVPICPAVAAVTDLPVQVLNTHWHFDHAGGNREFNRTAIFHTETELLARPLSNRLLRSLYLDGCASAGLALPKGFVPHQYEIANISPSRVLFDGEEIDLGERSLTVFHTPGHTRGSTSFLDSSTGFLFCGDLVYDGTLYAHFTDSNLEPYLDSLNRLIRLVRQVQSGRTNPAISTICAGHNSPLNAPDILVSARDLVEQALEGKTTPRTDHGWQSPVLRHGNGSLELLTPMPGSPGIDLLKMPLLKIP